MAELTDRDIRDAGLDDWQHSESGLRARYLTKSFMKGLGFVTAVAEAAEEANHHPDLTLTYSVVAVTLTSHDVGGVTSRDIDLARIITEHAESLGVSA